MIIRYFTFLLFFIIILISCTKEYDCYNLPIEPTFIGFDSSDIDTIVIRKFKAGDNYQNLIDTFVATSMNSSYSTSNDSTFVLVDYLKQQHKIKPDYDWQIFIPSINRTVLISDITSEKRKEKRSTVGETVGGYCSNRIFSVKVDNQLINFTDTSTYFAYIYN